MKIKLCIYEYIHEIKRNTFTVLSLCVTLILVLLFSSTLFSQLGEYLVFFSMLGNDRGIVVNTLTKETMEKLQNVETIISGKTYYLSGQDLTGKEYGNTIHVYNKGMSQYVTPVLSSGTWCDDLIFEKDIPCCVVLPNIYGYTSGDTISVQTSSGETFDLYISGVLEEDQYILNGMTSGFSSEELYYGSLMQKISSYSLNEEGILVQSKGIQCIVTEKQLQKVSELLDKETASFSNVVIQYNDDISEKEEKKNEQLVCEEISEFFGQPEELVHIDHLDIFMENSKKHIQNTLYTFVPIVCVCMLLSMVSLFIYEYMNINNALPRYSIYYLLGFRWKKMYTIVLFQNMFNYVFSVLLVIILYKLSRFTELKNYAFLSFNIAQKWTIFVIGIVYILIGSIIPYRYFHGSYPDQIIRSSKNE